MKNTTLKILFVSVTVLCFISILLKILNLEDQVSFCKKQVELVTEAPEDPHRKVLQENLKSTVQIEVYSKAVLAASPTLEVGVQLEGSSGSGVIVSSDGVILTAKHVIEKLLVSGDSFGLVMLEDGTSLKIEDFVSDPNLDLALVKVDPNGLDLSVARLGTMPEIGDLVWVIGNPLDLYLVVSQGVVSRIIDPTPEVGNTIVTNATMNPGNFGGPLFDQKGQLIGIAQGIISPGTFNVGLTFAIGVDVIKSSLCRMYLELEK